MEVVSYSSSELTVYEAWDRLLEKKSEDLISWEMHFGTDYAQVDAWTKLEHFVYLTWKFKWNQDIFRTHGFSGFTGTITASYFGETIRAQEFPVSLTYSGQEVQFKLGTLKETANTQPERRLIYYSVSLKIAGKKAKSEEETEKVFQFAKPEFSDAILLVEGVKINVNKTYLSMLSEYFNALFNSDFKEKSIQEIPIGHVRFKDFRRLLDIIHPTNPTSPTDDDAEILLALADRFMVPAVTGYVENFLLLNPNIPFCRILGIGDTFQLEPLLNRCLSMLKTMDLVKNLSKTINFKPLLKMDSSLQLNTQQFLPQLGILVTPVDNGGDYGLPMAIQEGFRLIDISDPKLDYTRVGEAIHRCIDGESIERESLYIIVSFHNQAYAKVGISDRINAILRDLQLDYVDLCLIDKPVSWDRTIDKPDMIRTPKRFPNDTRLDKIINQMHDEMLFETVAAVGLNGYNKQMIMQIHSYYPHLKISVVKSDITPYFQDKETRQYCRQKDIQVIGYNGGTLRRFKNTEPPLILENPVINDIAKRCGKREMQVVFRWLMDNGMAILSKTGPSKKLRLIQQITEFHLEPSDITLINELDQQEYSKEFSIADRVNRRLLEMPKVELNNGMEIPMIGIAMWHKLVYLDRMCHSLHLVEPQEKIQEREGLENALEAGFRHFDLGQVFNNQKMLGKIFKKYWDSGRIRRSDMFLTSKVWNTCHSFDACIGAVDKTLEDLQTDYIDLMLIHYPQGWAEDGKFINQKDSLIDYVETWKALEHCVGQGKVKGIGLCNFNLKQVQRILECAKLMPVVVQAELSVVYKKHLPLMRACMEKSIAFEAQWPFGKESTEPTTTISVDASKEVKAMAQYLGMKPRQLALIWLLQKGVIALPRAISYSECTSYLEALDHRLSDEDMLELDTKVPDSFPSWNDGIVDTNHRLWPWRSN